MRGISGVSCVTLNAGGRGTTSSAWLGRWFGAGIASASLSRSRAGCW